MGELDPVERFCRILCQFNGLPEDIKFQDKPMWEDFRAQAEALLAELKDGDRLPGRLVVKLKRR